MKKINIIIILCILISQSILSQSEDKSKEFTKINEALKNPEKVYRLNLSNQEIKWSTIDWSKFLNLEYINLKNDHLKEIPVGLTKIKSLKTIDLSGNDFILVNPTGISFRWSFFKLIYSKFLNLDQSIVDHLKEIPVGLTKIKSLKTIDLSGNDFKKLPESFSNLINLEEVYLNDEKNIDLPKTLEVLAKLPNLKSLHLENDNLSSLPSEMLLFKNLEFLYLNENKFIEIPRLEPLNHLKFLDLSNNKIKPEFQDLQNINFGFKINF